MLAAPSPSRSPSTSATRVRIAIAPRARARLWLGAFFALTFVVYTCVFPYLGAVNNPNENVRTYMTMALVEDHSFRIDRIVARHGWVNDMAKAPDKKTGEPHLFSVKAPATSWAGVPVYWAFTKIAPRWGHPVPTEASSLEDKQWWLRASTLVLRLFTIQLPCFAFLVWFERFLRGYSGDLVLRLAAVAAAGLGTNYLAYAMTFASHAPFACAAFGSFAIVARERRLFPDPRRRRLSRAFLAGALAGLCTLLEYHAAPVSGVLGLFALVSFWRPTRLLAYGVGAALNALALMYFQWRCFGSPFTPGHRMSENQAFAQILSQGYMGIGKPNGQVFKDVALSHAYGFFGTSPFMWLGLLAIPFGLLFVLRARADRAQHRVDTLAWLLMMLALFVTVSAAANWRGGWTIGPRYLGAAPPFFAFGAVGALEALSSRGALRRTLARGVAAGLAMASVAQTGLISIVYNTIPESVTRPLPQIALPFARTRFVPHHVGELLGHDGPRTWYVIAGCLLGAALLVALLPWRDRWITWAPRVLLAGLAFFVGLRPAFSPPAHWEDDDGGLSARRTLLGMWEPPGRDALSTLRPIAEKTNTPCAWLKVADAERTLGFVPEADRDAQRAGGTPPGVCQ